MELYLLETAAALDSRPFQLEQAPLLINKVIGGKKLQKYEESGLDRHLLQGCCSSRQVHANHVFFVESSIIYGSIRARLSLLHRGRMHGASPTVS
jgi:hypothetical protein